MERLHEIGSTVYEIGADTLWQYAIAVASVVAFAGGIVLGTMGRDTLTAAFYSGAAKANTTLQWIMQRGNFVAKRRRKKWLLEQAEDIITEGFENLFNEGKITEQEKTLMYRKLGISLSLTGLLPVHDTTKLKERIKKRLKMGLHSPVDLPPIQAENPMLSRLLASKKAA